MTLRDLARQLVSVSEAEISRREVTIVALRREVERLKHDLSESRKLESTIRSAKCETCVYRVIGLKVLAEKNKAEK